MKHPGAIRPPRGVSAVEIMVGLAIGLLLVAGMGSMVVGSRQTSRVERNLLEVQTIGRMAIDTLERELRKSGYRVNRERSIADTFAVAAPFTQVGAVLTGSDPAGGLTLRFVGTGDTWTADCLGNVVAAGNEVWQSIWLQDGQLQCRARNRTTNSDQTLALIPQVEALQVSYGIDDDGDGFADAYRASGAVADWSRVASVNLAVRVVSSEDALADRPQPYVGFDGAVATPTDRRLRRTYTSVVALRNLLP